MFQVPPGGHEMQERKAWGTQLMQELSDHTSKTSKEARGLSLLRGSMSLFVQAGMSIWNACFFQRTRVWSQRKEVLVGESWVLDFFNFRRWSNSCGWGPLLMLRKPKMQRLLRCTEFTTQDKQSQNWWLKIEVPYQIWRPEIEPARIAPGERNVKNPTESFCKAGGKTTYIPWRWWARGYVEGIAGDWQQKQNCPPKGKKIGVSLNQTSWRVCTAF